MTNPSAPQIRAALACRPGDHVCCFYETDAEQRAVATAFVRDGLRGREKVVYVLETSTPAALVDGLQRDGLDAARALAGGQLTLFNAEAAYLHTGAFNPEWMLAWLRLETARALAEGYAALRVTGEMAWALRDPAHLEPLRRYEARLNEWFPGSRCIGLCQYDRRSFEPAAQLDSLLTHPRLVVGAVPSPNPYYLPPSECLRSDVRQEALRRIARDASAAGPALDRSGMDRVLDRLRQSAGRS